MKSCTLFIVCLSVAISALSYASLGEMGVRSGHRIKKRAVTIAHVLTDKQKKMILDKNNEMRGSVEPTAANMLKMKWNNTLEEIATTYSRKCIYEHNHGPGMENYGENLYLSTEAVSDQFAIKGMVKWFDERLDYTYETGACSKVCGHYTQLVWAQTDMVGCGMSTCANIDVGNGQIWPTASLLVCNYQPAGNVQGRSVYEEGSWCSKCPEGYRCSSDGKLCSSSTRSIPTWTSTISILLLGLSWQLVSGVY